MLALQVFSYLNRYVPTLLIYSTCSFRKNQVSIDSNYFRLIIFSCRLFSVCLLYTSNLSNPASGLKFGGSLYHGEVLVLPPMEPIKTAADAFAASIASSVNGTPVASMEHPPIKISSYSNSCPNSLPTLSNTFFADVYKRQIIDRGV